MIFSLLLSWLLDWCFLNLKLYFLLTAPTFKHSLTIQPNFLLSQPVGTNVGVHGNHKHEYVCELMCTVVSV